MIVIPPATINAEHLIACDIPEVDAAAGEVLWSPGVNYQLNDVVVRTETQQRYRNLNPGIDGTPPELAPKRWQALRYTNRWAMFRYLTNDASERASSLSMTLRLGRRVNSVFLRGMVADYAVIIMRVNGQEVRRIERKLNARQSRTWSDYYFGAFPKVPSLVISDLPPYTGAELTITLTRAGSLPVRVEHVALGNRVWLGHADWSPRNDALNFSTIDRDRWGGIILDPVKSAPTLRVRVRIPKHNVNSALRTRNDLDAAPALWAALDDDTNDGYAEAVTIFGPYRRFPIDVSNVKESVSDIDLESM